MISMAGRVREEVVEVEVEVDEGDGDGDGDNVNTSMTLVGWFLTYRPIRVHIMMERMASV